MDQLRKVCASDQSLPGIGRYLEAFRRITEHEFGIE
jgi:hypothetical protein